MGREPGRWGSLAPADGGWAKVLAVERVRLAEPELVYNFTVKGPHTYFVLEVGVLVHNNECYKPPASYTGSEGGFKNNMLDYDIHNRAMVDQRLAGEHLPVDYIYVIDLQGNIRLAPRQEMLDKNVIDNHSFLVQGENVHGAGHITFGRDREGNLVVKEVTAISGHYRSSGGKDFGPKFKNYLNELLQQHGLRVEKWGNGF